MKPKMSVATCDTFVAIKANNETIVKIPVSRFYNLDNAADLAREIIEKVFPNLPRSQ